MSLGVAVTVERPTATHCPYCALQCGMSLTKSDSGPRIEPRDFPTSRGGLCRKGWTAAHLLTDAHRLTEPLVRDIKGGPLRTASWPEAVERVVTAITTVQRRHGRDAVGVFGGGGLTNEKAYLLGKFARVALRTASIDYNGRFCMSSAASAAQRAFGVDRGLPFPVDDISRADLVVLVGANVAETMPPIMRHFTAQQAAGGRLIVIDPRRTPTAASADLHLQPVPGADLALAHGLLHLVIEQGLVDHAFVRDRTAGFADVRALVRSFWPERVERMTGVPVTDLRSAVAMLGAARTVMVLTARGAEQHATGTDTVLAFINLALALGQAGRPWCGYGAITGQGNGQGGREHGQKSDQLPGYRRIDDPVARAHVAEVWGVSEDSLPGAGTSAYEMLDALGDENGVRGLLVFGSNPVISAPNATHVEKQLKSLDFLAVCDVVGSETAAIADVVLPVAQWAEETGTLTNLEGRVIMRRKAIDPPPGVRTDLQVLSMLADGLGVSKGFPQDPEQVFKELALASNGGVADYSGISYQRIEADGGVFWPCPSTDHPGTPRLFLDAFATSDGRARFHAVDHRGSAELPNADFPLYLTTGRVLSQYQSGAQTRRVPELTTAAPGGYVEVHPALAARYGVSDGEMLRVTTRRGEAVLAARLTPTIRGDTLFVPFHWGGSQRANNLTNPALDPISRMPEFKTCAARLERACGQ